MKAGVDWLEAGTPLIKSEGLDAVRELRKRFPKATIIADMKTMDAGRVETESAAKAGANIVCILAVASDSTVSECVRAGKNYGVQVEADLIEVEEGAIEKRARELEKLGVNIVGVHVAIDEQMKGKDPFSRLRRVAKAVTIPVACAGGINSETAPMAVKAGADIVVVGGAINKAGDPERASRNIKKAIKTKRSVKTSLYKRVSASDVKKVLKLVSTSNISDAMHRTGDIKDIRPVIQGVKIAGPVLTVRTYPGDWAKTVQAVDRAEPGQIIAIDAGGVGPAVWGELATHGAIQKKVAGVVIDGATRDTPEIRKLGFPVFAKLVTPAAGEPKGFGEIGITVTLSGTRVSTGDWIIGDDDGLVCVPEERIAEVTNRAMGILEQENRLRTEIDSGSTLAQVAELLRWEKKQ
jgi:3-hexulose-6-phosphate synthase/6-phospho-3-hexuloisomerase